MNNFNIPDWDNNQVGDAVSKEFDSVAKLAIAKKARKKSPKGKKQAKSQPNANKKVAKASKTITKERTRSPNKSKQEEVSSELGPAMKKAVVVLRRQNGVGVKAKKVAGKRSKSQTVTTTSPLMREALVVLRRQNDLDGSSTLPTIVNKPGSSKDSPKSQNRKKKTAKNSPIKEISPKETPAKKVMPVKKSLRNIKQITSPPPTSPKKESPAKRGINQLNPASTAIKKPAIKKAKKTIKLKVAGLLANKNAKVEQKPAVNGTSQRPTTRQGRSKKDNVETSPVKQGSPGKKTAAKGTANKTIKKAKDTDKEREKITKAVKTELSPVKKGGKRMLKESLNVRMTNQLKSARFRFINEELYTKSSSEAVKMFKEDPDAYTAYHDGYRKQVDKWPMNPLTKIVNTLRKMPQDTIIADFGCGDAMLSKSLKQKVHSFDLVAGNERVVACDMSKVPLASESVDVAVFCLSLMGTNLHDYILEANRVLKVGGLVKIVDIESRFEKVDTFIAGVTRFGFDNTSKNFDHNLFHFMDFRKVRNIKNKKNLPTISLLPCLYKRR